LLSRVELQGGALLQDLEQAPARGLGWRLLATPTFTVGALIVSFWVLAALATSVFPLVNPLGVDPVHTLAPPSPGHWLGTDDLGRDVLARVLAGSASVLSIAPAATLLGLAGGVTLGLVSGYYRGFADDLLMRGADILMSLPVVITAVVALALLGSSEVNVILVIGFLFTPFVARTVRSAVLPEREREYVEAARLRGEKGPFVMAAEILPNVRAPIIVEATLRLGYAAFAASTLSFLRLGVQPPSPDWGLTIALEQPYIQIAPWTVLFPALALASLVVGVNLVADGLSKVLAA